MAPDSLNNMVYIAGMTSNEVVALNLDNPLAEKRWTDIPSPSGLSVSPGSMKLFVTCAIPEGKVVMINLTDGKKLPDLPAGHTPMAPVISPDGKILFICNRFNNDIWLIDIEKRSVIVKIPVLREPVAMVMDSAGRFLFVANHLPAEPENSGDIASAVSLIDIQGKKVITHIRLPNGSTSLRGICISPDDRYVFVTHILAKYQLPTTQLERGWMNTNALSIIDVRTKALFATVPLDDVDHGTANPWAVKISQDGRQIFVTHAGTHEISIIDAPRLFAKLIDEELLVNGPDEWVAENGNGTGTADVSNDLTFLTDIRHRIPLPGKGPRAIALLHKTAYIGEYFSDQIVSVDFGSKECEGVLQRLSSSDITMDAVREGEMLFNDATLCFQDWQSCASCHPDGRADGLNWDLLNDGIGNPKNTKSLLLSMQTPPVMINGIRDHAKTAVRSGFKSILFTTPSDHDATAIDAFLGKLKPLPSPFLQKGKLTEAALRGKKIYSQSGCTSCHPKPLFTNLKKYDVGTGSGSEKSKAFDTPTLVEIWRTAPYLNDGRAGTIQEILIEHNKENIHGNLKDLSNSGLQDLFEYILSL